MPFHPQHPARSHRPNPAPEHQPPIQAGIDAAEGPLLYTPAEAAQRLKVRESWLRKKAAARQVPCTFLGKHLRFSPNDLAAILAAAAQSPVGRARRRRAPIVRDRDLPTGPDRSVHPPDIDDHIPDGSS